MNQAINTPLREVRELGKFARDHTNLFRHLIS